MWVDLNLFSRDLQNRYYATASDANLVSWNTAPDGSGNGYDLTDRFAMGDADTLYAQWEVPTDVMLTLNGNGCSWNQVYWQLSGSQVSLSALSTEVEQYYRNHMQAGAVLTGWNTRADGGGTAYAPTDSFIPLYNITLYAQWQLPEATEVASGEYADGLKWTLNSHGQLTVTGTGDMPDGSRPWNRYQDRIASVVIGEGITRVGSYAFDGYHAITAVTLPESLVSIGYDAFWNCSLTSVTLGSSIRSVEPGAFMNCSTPFTVYGDVSQVLVDYVYNDPHGNYASFPDDTIFYWEEGSDTEVVGKWEVGSYDETDVTATLYASGRLVIQGKGAFDKSPWSRRITSVEIGEGITAIGNNVFDGCTELTTVTTPRSLVKVGNYAFRNCYALKKVSDLSNVTYFGWYAFYNCSMLTSADLASAEEIQHYAFYNSGIDEAELDSIRYIDTEAFRNCKNLRSVIIGEELEWLGEQVFADCPVLQYVDWMCANELDLYAESNLFLNSGKEIQSIKDNAGIILYAYTEHIPAYLFYTSAELAGQEPNLVQVITKDNSRYATPVTIGEFAFYRAVHLKQVSPLPEVQSIGDGAFNSCEALTEITVGDSLHTLGAKAFFRTGLTSFASGRSLETIGENAFGQCSEDFFLQGYPDSALHKYADEYAIPFVEMNTSGQLGDISWSFEEATGTLTLTGNGKVTAAPWEHLASQVEHIVLSEGITLLDEGVFAGMEVEELVFPASLATLCADFIGNVEHAFFLGAAPEVDVDSEPVELPFHYAYYLQNTPGWSSCGWENDLYPFENRQGTMTLKEVTDDYSLDTPVTGYVGKKIALKAYSSLAQGRYDEEYGFGMTVSAWTDGTTRYAFNAVITLQDGLTLTAAWESVKFTVDGVEYPANTAASGTGWSYDGDTLTLNGYNGGGIEFPGDVDIVAQGTNTVSDGIFAEGELYLVVESGNTTVIRSSDNRKGYALDSDYLYLEVKEGAALNVSSAEGRAIYSAGNIYLNCDGTLNVTSANYAYAVYTAKRIYLSGSGVITAQGAKQALYGKTEVVFRSGFDIYLSADATEPAAEYATTPYLRLEGSKWSMTLHANGGTWGDGSAAGKVVTATSGGDIYLGEYSYLLTREGYVLTGWTDEGNTMEFTLSDDVYFEDKEVTLYAVWEKDALTVDGKTFAIDAPASGNGWSYTPAEGKNRANLTISEGYSGKPVAFTRALDVVITADTVITGTAGVPGISALGALRLTVEDADVTVTGGSGQHAVYTGGLLYLYNYGRTTLTGGAGGSGIYANYVQFYSYAGSALTATGGTRASAVWTETFRLQEASGIITLVGGDGRIAVDCGHWTCSGEPRFYAGENAADLFRAENLWDANDYAYFRIQPKLVVVNMDANGGAINGSMTATLSLLQAEDNSFLLLSGAAPVREGYLFTGWNTRADGSGTAYQDGESYTVREDATLNLFAQWEELPAPEASFGTGTAGQPQLTVEIPETLPEAAKESTVLAVCYDRTTGQMLASAFGTEKSTQWVFDIAQKENARWMLFFLKDVSHAPAFSNLELKIQQ